MGRYIYITLVFLLSAPTMFGQQISIGFYNVENLYDTIPSLFYDDSDFTPNGSKRWNTERYNTKVANISRVVDDMALDIVAIAEVENEGVVRELVSTLNTDYNYIHRTTNDYRGMDIALLYKGDKFFPERIVQVDLQTSRQGLYVTGRLLGQRIDIVAVHLPSQLNTYATRERSLKALYRFADSLRREDPQARIVIVGDMNATPDDKVMRRAFHTESSVHDGKIFLFNPFLTLRGVGTYVYRDRWMMLDNIFLATSFTWGAPMQFSRAGVFIRDYMLCPQGRYRGQPQRTFAFGQYAAGFSDHLPLFVVLEK